MDPQFSPLVLDLEIAKHQARHSHSTANCLDSPLTPTQIGNCLPIVVSHASGVNVSEYFNHMGDRAAHTSLFYWIRILPPQRALTSKV